MKNLLLLLLLLFNFGCSSKIHKNFSDNRYVKSSQINFVNDKLNLRLNMPADMDYTTNKKELKKIIKSQSFKLKAPVLLFAKTYDPAYEYFLTVSEKRSHNYLKPLVVVDTVINNKVYRFIGNDYGRNGTDLITDMTSTLKSLYIGENYIQKVTNVFDVVNKYKKSNRFYSILKEINDYPSYNKKDKWSKLQMQLTFSSFLGAENNQYVSHLNQFYKRYKFKGNIKNKIANGQHKNVLDSIVKQARNHKLLMINENHFYPSHRLLVSDLLLDLKNIGYNYLAIEGLDKNQDSILNLQNSFPKVSTGFYTSEHNFSNLIRKAKKMGFKFVSYDYYEKKQNRELAQAENLYTKTFAKEKNSKVIVLAGLAHIFEKETRNKKWLACLIKDNYGIDPLTISQSHLNYYGKFSKSDYTILKSDVFTEEKYKNVDFHVINNRKLKFKKTNYNYKNPTKKKVQLSLFYAKECKKRYDYQKNCPYYTKVIEENKLVNLPIFEDTVLMIFDENGRKIDSKNFKI